VGTRVCEGKRVRPGSAPREAGIANLGHDISS
jgi:hypothetical protein